MWLQVAYKKTEAVYLVLSLDYGQIKEVTQSQIYHPCQSVAHIMASTALYTIKGSLFPPFGSNLSNSSQAP